MLQELVDKYMANKNIVEEMFKKEHPSYTDIVEAVIKAINKDDDYGLPDSKCVHRIDDGDWQGTLVFVIAELGYQPYRYWAVTVAYGSCSGCDTLQAICDYDDDPPTEQQVKDYMTLALHIVQGLKEI